VGFDVKADDGFIVESFTGTAVLFPSSFKRPYILTFLVNTRLFELSLTTIVKLRYEDSDEGNISLTIKGNDEISTGGETVSIALAEFIGEKAEPT